MKLLLDTHTLLWYATADPQLSSTATVLLTDPSNDLFLSTATLWEVAIKAGLKKLAIAGSYGVFMTQAITGYGLTVLPITLEDCAEYEHLPFPDPQHRDPFDRMIVVHPLRHGLSVVGVDGAFDPYGLARLW